MTDESSELQGAPEKLPGPNRKVVFQPPFFMGYVKLGGRIYSVCRLFLAFFSSKAGCDSWKKSSDSYSKHVYKVYMRSLPKHLGIIKRIGMLMV